MCDLKSDNLIRKIFIEIICHTLNSGQKIDKKLRNSPDFGKFSHLIVLDTLFVYHFHIRRNILASRILRKFRIFLVLKWSISAWRGLFSHNKKFWVCAPSLTRSSKNLQTFRLRSPVEKTNLRDMKHSFEFSLVEILFANRRFRRSVEPLIFYSI